MLCYIIEKMTGGKGMIGLNNILDKYIKSKYNGGNSICALMIIMTEYNLLDESNIRYENIKKLIDEKLEREVALKANEYLEILNKTNSERIDEILEEIITILKLGIVGGREVIIEDTYTHNNFHNGKITLNLPLNKYLKSADKMCFEDFLKLRIYIYRLLYKTSHTNFKRFKGSNYINLTCNYELLSKAENKSTDSYKGSEILINTYGIIGNDEKPEDLSITLDENGIISCEHYAVDKSIGISLKEFFSKNDVLKMFNLKIELKDVKFDNYNELMKIIIKTHDNKLSLLEKRSIKVLGTILTESGYVQHVKLTELVSRDQEVIY